MNVATTALRMDTEKEILEKEMYGTYKLFYKNKMNRVLMCSLIKARQKQLGRGKNEK